MNNIIIVPFHYWGPLNGSLKLSHILKQNGYNVIYVISQEFKDYVAAQGFEVFVYETPKKEGPNNWFSRVRKTYLNLKKRDTLIEEYAQQIMTRFKPIIVFNDSDIPRYAAVLQKHVPLVLYAVNPSNDREENIPPYFSNYIPKDSLGSKLYVDLVWRLWFLTKKIYFLKYEILSLGYFDFSLRRYYAKNKLDKRNLNSERSWPVGLKNIPELFFYPAEFDFNKKNNTPNKYYVGPMVDLERDRDMPFEWEPIKSSKYTICCVMGTLADFYYPEIDRFYNLLIEAIKTRSDIMLILVAPGNNSSLNIGDAKNIFLYSKVPLSKVLEKCDLFINHAGFNSVKESILKAVPLLLLPLSHQNDQRGVAARCVFHGIAKRQNIRKTSALALLNDIDELLVNKSYKDNIIRWKGVFMASEWEKEALLTFIKSRIR